MLLDKLIKFVLFLFVILRMTGFFDFLTPPQPDKPESNYMQNKF
jgi:hypothetical protein